MKNFFTVFALMVSMTGVAISLAREEVRCYLNLSSSACHSANESPSSTQNANSPSSQTESSSSSQTQQTQEQKPLNLPSSIEELTKVGKEVKDAITPSSSSDSSEDTTNPSTQAEEPPTEPTQVSEQPTEQTTEVSSPSTDAQPITESVELEVIPPPEDNTNSSEPTQH